MDAVSALEDLDKLVAAEDLIILALRDSWQVPKTGRLPAGFCLDSAKRVLTMDEKTLTANGTLLGQNNVTTAVFAGCSGFKSATSFRMAAKQVLVGAETLAIVHNKDMVWDLVDWFPTVKALLLPHNVRLQFDYHLRLLPPARHSDLEELLGNTSAMGSTDLHINRNAITALLAKCPKLRRLQSSLHGDLMSGAEHPAYDAVLSHEALRSCHELRLGCYLERVDNTAVVMHGISAKGLACAHKVFPEVTYLELVLQSPDVAPLIAKFTRLTALVVTFSYKVSLLGFTPGMSVVLDKLPLLEELSLNYFKGVSVRDIARKCPRLRKLSLMHCVLDCESAVEVRRSQYPFPPRALEVLRINVLCSDLDYLLALLTSCAGQIKQLWLGDPSCCHTFIRAATTRTQFTVLERLTLNTDWQASKFMKQDDHLQLPEALPALKHLSTDSFDLRLLFWNFVSPPGSVKLSWCQCTICAVEFPRVDEAQKKFWGELAGHLR